MLNADKIENSIKVNMEMTAVLWVLYAFILPQFGILSSGKEIIYSKVLNRAPDNADSMAHNPLKGTMEQLSCGVEDDKSQISDVSHLDMLDHDSSTDKDGRVKRSASAEKSQRKTIEVAVFVDSAFYSRYQDRTSDDPKEGVFRRVRDIMQMAQTYYSHHTLDIKFKLETVKIEVMNSNESAPNNHGGEASPYLRAFCDWQSKRNKAEGAPGHWDHAALITGMDIFSKYGGVKDTLFGMASVGTMCGDRSCSINKGTHYHAGATVAHEIAHSLGAYDDGKHTSCNSKEYFMSGGVALNWSPCSNNDINNFIRKKNPLCLADDTSSLAFDSLHSDVASLAEQCKLALGPGYSPYQNSESPYDDVCCELWCKSDSDLKSAGQALDGSPCGENKRCLNGCCQPEEP